jgi:riboflavin synthase
VVVKGSITVDGVSLTVGDLSAGRCRIFIIPETLARTLIGSYRAGERVNIEVDLVAKYVESLLVRKGTW